MKESFKLTKWQPCLDMSIYLAKKSTCFLDADPVEMLRKCCFLLKIGKNQEKSVPFCLGYVPFLLFLGAALII